MILQGLSGLRPGRYAHFPRWRFGKVNSRWKFNVGLLGLRLHTKSSVRSSYSSSNIFDRPSWLLIRGLLLLDSFVLDAIDGSSRCFPRAEHVLSWFSANGSHVLKAVRWVSHVWLWINQTTCIEHDDVLRIKHAIASLILRQDRSWHIGVILIPLHWNRRSVAFSWSGRLVRSDNRIL